MSNDIIVNPDALAALGITVQQHDDQPHDWYVVIDDGRVFGPAPSAGAALVEAMRWLLRASERVAYRTPGHVAAQGNALFTALTELASEQAVQREGA